MATEILMPRQGQSVESCIIIEWKVNEGDVVTEGQALCEVETDKATFEVEATAAGTVLGIFYPADADVDVLKVIAAIGEPGEDVSGLRPEEPQNIEQGTSKAEGFALGSKFNIPCSPFDIQSTALYSALPNPRINRKIMGRKISPSTVPVPRPKFFAIPAIMRMETTMFTTGMKSRRIHQSGFPAISIITMVL